MVQPEAEFPHQRSGNCLSKDSSDTFAMAELTSITDGKPAVVLSLIVRENFTMRWTALHYT